MSRLGLYTPAIAWGNPVNRTSPLNRGLVAWWLSRPSYRGATFYDIAGFRHGTLTNMDPATDWSPSSHTRGFGALDFDGSNDYVQCLGSATVTEATFSAWVKITATQAAYAGIILSRGTSVNGVNFSNDGTRLAYTWLDSAATYNWTGGPVVSTSEWAFLCVSVTGAAATAYQYTNSSGWTSGTNSNTHGTATLDDIRLGDDEINNFPGPRYLAGQAADLRFFNRALSESEVYAICYDSLRGYPLTLNRVRRPIYGESGGGGGGFQSAWASGSNVLIGI